MAILFMLSLQNILVLLFNKKQKLSPTSITSLTYILKSNQNLKRKYLVEMFTFIRTNPTTTSIIIFLKTAPALISWW